AAALSGRKLVDADVTKASVQAKLGHSLGNSSDISPRSFDREPHVVDHREVVVEKGRMAEQANGPADRPPVTTQIVAEDLGLPLRDREQPGAGAEEAGLTGAVGPLEQDDLAPGHVEVDAGKGGEASEEGDGGPEADGRGHGDDLNATGARRRS